MFTPKWMIYPWISAVLSIILLSFELVSHLPKSESLLSKINSFSTLIKNRSNINCCFATTANNNTFKNAIVLAHSLNNIGIDPPPSYIFVNKDINEKGREILSKYFTVVESKNPIDEYNFWTLENCSVVVAVKNNGVFIKDMNHICYAPPFSAVAKQGDVVSFDTSMMVLDPKDKMLFEKRSFSSQQKSFEDFANENIPEWNILPSDLSVEDYKNDYLVFWSTYSRPTYIHYNPIRFVNVSKNFSSSFGNKALSPMIKSAMKNANEEFPYLGIIS